ncbi:hypothetical protein, partial [Bacillus sp. WP8]|uniref:hypothetical protein n=1 Tax=Bacillus sp. WP8 TaxID=756828 RepID=UPI0011A7FF5B
MYVVGEFVIGEVGVVVRGGDVVEIEEVELVECWGERVFVLKGEEGGEVDVLDILLNLVLVEGSLVDLYWGTVEVIESGYFLVS